MAIGGRQEGPRSLVVRAGAAVVVLAVLVVGVPAALVTLVGWPLPRHLPSLSGMAAAVTQRGLSDATVVDLLACVAWVAWAVLMAAVASEVVAVARARRTRVLPGMRSAHLIAAHLITTIVMGLGAFSRPTPPAQAAPIRAMVAVTSPAPTLVVAAAVSPLAATPTLTASAPATNGLDAYVVVAHDTLWSIAERELGDPLQWRAIFALNEGRPQARGGALVDPHWIDPGWVLELPSPSIPAAAPPPASAAPTATPPAPGLTTESTTPPVPTPSAPFTPHVDPPLRHPAHRAPHPGARAVTLGSGSTIAPSFLAGLATASLVSRLRRRRSYRPKKPAPGRDLSPPDVPPAAVEALRAVGLADPTEPSADDRNASLGNLEAREPPDDTLEVGATTEGPIGLDLAAYPTLAVDGPVQDDVVRSLCATLAATHLDAPVDVVMTVATSQRLFPGLDLPNSWQAVSSTDDLVRRLEAELLAHARRNLEAVELNGWASGDQGAPRLVTVLAHDEALDPTLVALAGGREGAGITMVLLGRASWASASVRVDHGGRVLEASPESLAVAVSGATLFHVSVDDLAGLLTPLLAAWADPVDDETEAPVSTPPPDPSDQWPGPSTAVENDNQRPRITVEALGPLRIVADGQEITAGLRTVAKELLGWFLLRPEGATIEAAVDAIWPDTPPDLVSTRFWRALANLRTVLRTDPTAPKPQILVKRGDRYVVDATEVGSDVWDFQRHLGEASEAPGPDTERVALSAAASLYRGDFLVDLGSVWIGPSREDLHRRALDVLVRLAQLEAEDGEHERAAGHLERAVGLDPYAELVACRLMEQLAQLGRTQQFRSTWDTLQRSLSEIGADPSPSAQAHYQRLDQELRDSIQPKVAQTATR